jgi:hypothetical protein
VDGIDGSDGVQSKGSGKVMKRAKVTAVACQPCQRRKSKVGSLLYLFELISNHRSVMDNGQYALLAQRKEPTANASMTLRATNVEQRL